MNLEGLMEVWRSQEVAPLHGVNETLLRLALREDEAKLRAQVRREEWITSIVSAALVAIMVAFFVLIVTMFFFNEDDVIAGWDFAVPIVGAVPAVLMGIALYKSRRAQTLREQRFGDSVRDQLGRQIAQIDYQMTRAVWLGAAIVATTFVGGAAIQLAGARVNLEPNQSFEDWSRIARILLVGAIVSVIAIRAARRRANREMLPRRRRLEALLMELDGA